MKRIKKENNDMKWRCFIRRDWHRIKLIKFDLNSGDGYT